MSVRESFNQVSFMIREHTWNKTVNVKTYYFSGWKKKSGFESGPCGIMVWQCHFVSKDNVSRCTDILNFINPQLWLSDIYSNDITVSKSINQQSP